MYTERHASLSPIRYLTAAESRLQASTFSIQRKELQASYVEIAGSVAQVRHSQVLFLGKPKDVPYAKACGRCSLGKALLFLEGMDGQGETSYHRGTN